MGGGGRHCLLQQQPHRPRVLWHAGKAVPGSGNYNLDSSYHPLWAAGITGAGQVIGTGDSGLGDC